MQAYALSLILKNVPEFSEVFDVGYFDFGAGERDAEFLGSFSKGDILCAQLEMQPSAPYLARASRASLVTFPWLRFFLLWPMACANLYNRPDPPELPFGKFPIGDSFVVSSVQQGVPPDEILQTSAGLRWFESWPDPDRVQAVEFERLAATDRANDVKIADFILANFSKRRLFSHFFGPTNALLTEFAARLAAACGVEADPCRFEAAAAVVFPSEPFGDFSTPIHPYLAKKFRLEWYRRTERFPVRAHPPLTYYQYFQTMIAYSYAVERDESGIGVPT